MELIRSPRRPTHPALATAVAIGNFDGLHLGHQALIEAAIGLAEADDLAPALMCFEPLPMTFFNPDRPVRRLMSVRDKLAGAHRAGVQQTFMQRFNRAFSQLSSEAFVQRCVVDEARARHVVVGEDFRFGARALGDVSALRQFGARFGFEVHTVPAVKAWGQRIASTGIRDALLGGDLGTAESMLGRSYAISGRVLRGQQLGRQLGYPTINLRPPTPPAVHGVYAVRVSAAGDTGLSGHPGVASIGQRPTVGGLDWLLEVHLFDYDGVLYGQHVEVEFAAYIRPEAHFDSLEAMVDAMHDDAKTARAHLHA